MRGLLRRLLPPGAASAALRTLDIHQQGATLSLRLGLRPGTRVHGAFGFRPDAEAWWPLSAPEGTPEDLRLSVDLRDLTKHCPEPLDDGALVELFLDISHPVTAREAAAFGEEAPELVVTEGPGGVRTARYRLQVGAARRTRTGALHEVEHEGRVAAPYTARSGFVTVAVDRPLRPLGAVYVNRITVDGGVLRLRGRVTTRHGDLEQAELLLKGRTSGIRLARPVPLTPDPARTERSFGHRWYDFAVAGDLAQLLDDERLDDEVFDLWFTLTTAQHPEPFSVRVGRTRLVTRLRTRPGWTASGEHAAAIVPYYTFKAAKTSIQVVKFDAETFAFLRRQLRQRHLLRVAHLGRPPVWLVGERAYKAQDTGYHFFRFLRRNHPEIDAYYVIDPESPEYANVAPLGNVLPQRSKEHVRAALVADRVIGSHHPDYLYPLRTTSFRRAVRATRVFLQHGVMGTKWMEPNYGKGQGGFETDLFLVSSEREKELIVSDFGYEPDEVAVTGLSRFDALFAGDVPPRPQLLVIPTWRDWLLDSDVYEESEYHHRWSELLHDPRLRALAEQYGLEVVFCLHPNMQGFTSLFADAPVTVLSQGEVDIQRLLKQGSVLVTDYSSVGFDFSFLHKPVVYYQFDRQRFLGPRGSHLDLDEELPGPVQYSAARLLGELERLGGNGFAMDPEYQRRADRFIAHRDRHNCERIFDAVSQAKPARLRRGRAVAHELRVSGEGYLRRSSYYTPAMEALFRLVSRLPADDRLVVFESTVGRQFADSPRYVYEELVRRGSDLKKVWAYSGKIHSGDDRTRVVERLSPLHYYYLARAKYWVNNQNLPNTLHRRPDGVYLQTWHGTPLKKMLHDLDTIRGRTEGYLERVSEAAAQWSVLLTASRYATEAMRSAFRYDGEVLETGYPRNDVLVAPDRDAQSARIRRRLGIPEGTTVVLYAPTFRDDQMSRANRFTFRLPIDLERFHATTGDDVMLLLRMHMLVRDAVEIPETCASSVLDVSLYPEVQELFLAADVLVTDYSSVFFDYANLRRPIIFYATDLASYRDELRGFYLDYEKDLPGPVVTTEDGLYKALGDLAALEREHGPRFDEFLARFNPHEDGHATERVVDHVFGPDGRGYRG